MNEYLKARTVGELRKILETLPDDMPVALKDPNFGGSLNDRWRTCLEMDVDSFRCHEPTLLIDVPCIAPFED